MRLHLAISVVQNLQGLSTATRNQYAADLQTLSDLCANGATTVNIRGNLEIDRDRWLAVDTSLPLDALRESARRVGAYIATTKLDALHGHSIQAIETWDDADELTAGQIAEALTQDRPVVDMGDDAQILAGATLALGARPELYDAVTKRINDALDRSFATDPIWATPSHDPLIARARLHLRPQAEARISAVEGAAHTGAAAPTTDDTAKKQTPQTKPGGAPS